MPGLQIPGSLCESLHPDYRGPDSPPKVLDEIVKAARAMVVQVIQDGIAPPPIPETHDPGITRNVSFPAPIAAVIGDYAFEHQLQDSQVIRAYLYAAIARGHAIEHRVQVIDDLRPYTKALKFGRRVEQSALFDCLTDSLTTGKIGMVEGATGIGKTLAIVAAAAEAIPKMGRVVVTAPTLQILRDFINTHASLAAKLPSMPNQRTVFGRQEFVSRLLLEATLDEGIIAVDATPIRDWLASGAPPIGKDVALDQAYLCSSLLQISPGFPVEGVRLTSQTPEDDPGHAAYRRQFIEDEEGEPLREILYCTHAMIAIDLRRTLIATWASSDTEDAREAHKERIRELRAQRKEIVDGERESPDRSASLKTINEAMAKESSVLSFHLAQTAIDKDIGFLPPWQGLIIDEAHTFETNVANVLASSISIMEFSRSARQAHEAGMLSTAAAKRVAGALAALRRIPIRTNDGVDLNNVADPVCMEARVALAEAADAVSSARTPKEGGSSGLDRLKQDARTIKRALLVSSKSASLHASRLKFSPVREFPQLSYGRRSVEQELQFLWNRAAGAACVSATLYLRRTDRFSSDYMASILRIPAERLREYAPIRPLWSLEPVCGLWQPERIPGWLRPPSRSDKLSKHAYEEAVGRWHSEVATELLRIHQSAEGGTLVLMTSYESIRQVAALIHDQVDGLVQSNPKTTLAAQRSLFVEISAAGRKPIWLALGGAWTGLDINGEHLGLEAEEDNLLTDLVIPRLPFNLNMSLTHAYRMESRPRVPWELLDTTMRTKQGLGRLVRREGLPRNRRIFVLDGRMHDPKFENFLGPIRTLFGVYPIRAWPRGE